MNSYRIFEFNQSAVIDRAHDVRLPDDDAARRYAAGLDSRHPVEVWRSRERIAFLPPMRLAS